MSKSFSRLLLLHLFLSLILRKFRISFERNKEMYIFVNKVLWFIIPRGYAAFIFAPVIIIITYFHLYFQFFYNPSPNIFSRPRVWEGCNFMHAMYLGFATSFESYFTSLIDNTLIKRIAIQQSAIIFISLGLGRLSILISSWPFLDHTQGSHYYCYSGSLKVFYSFSYFSRSLYLLILLYSLTDFLLYVGIDISIPGMFSFININHYIW